jgi:hypothetical protein
MKNKKKQDWYLSHEEFERTLRQLGRMSESFRKNSLAEKAIRRAAEAMLYIRSDAMNKQFADFMLAKKKDLTRAQILHLRAIGIDPYSKRKK